MLGSSIITSLERDIATLEERYYRTSSLLDYAEIIFLQSELNELLNVTGTLIDIDAIIVNESTEEYAFISKHFYTDQRISHEDVLACIEMAGFRLQRIVVRGNRVEALQIAGMYRRLPPNAIVYTDWCEHIIENIRELTFERRRGGASRRRTPSELGLQAEKKKGKYKKLPQQIRTTQSRLDELSLKEYEL